jgi:site-specific recombinase XerD
MGMTEDDFAELATFWETSLRNRNISPRTIRSYLTGLRLYAEWCGSDTSGRVTDIPLTRRSAEAFTASIIGAGKSASTAAARQIALRLFSAWCAEEGEIQRDELLGLKAPKLDEKVVEGLTPEEMRALLAACAGRRFTDIRDTALVRFMHNCGLRADEVVSMKVIDLQVGARSAVVTRGKGAKGRRVGFGDRTAESLSRYLRARRRHPAAELPDLWLAWRNGRRADPSAARGMLTYEGLTGTLGRRAEMAGIKGFSPHRLRHTWAVAWARAGGSTTGLMAAGGWTTIEMPMRYFGSAQQDLAAEEAQRLGLDDI